MPEQAKASANPQSRLEAGQRRRTLEMAKSLSATLGKDFIESMVRNLANTFQADCAYVSELKGAHQDRMRTVAVYRKDGEAQDFEQGLSGTASGRVLLEGTFTCGKDAAQAFPQDQLLVSMRAQGYAGVSLCDGQAQPLGVLAVVSRERLSDTRLIKGLLEAFAPRTAAELERKRTEEVLRENEERYHVFVTSNPDAMWRIEFSEPIPLTLGEDEQIDRMYRFGYVAECNDAAARLFDAESVEQLIGSPFGRVVPRTNPALAEEIRSAIRSGFHTATVETTPVGADGQLHYRLRSRFGIVENGELRRVWGTSRDITGLRRAELSLAASERRFREVLEGMQLPAVMVDLHGKITFANPCFLELSGRSREELAALNWLGGVVPAEESGIWRSILQPGQRATTHFEGAIMPREGPPHAIEWSTIGLRDQGDRVEEIAAIGRDVTRERALEMEIRQSQKLEGIGKVASGVAHDFNNVLTVIMGHTAPLLEHVAESDSMRAHVAAIDEATNLCAKLTAQLLAFGRKQHLHPEFILLNDTIASADSVLRGLTGAGIDVHFDLQPDLWRVYADPTQVLRALSNLVINARDAMPDGGKLVIATSNLAIGAEDPAYPGTKPGNYVRLAVKDTGIGLTEEVWMHIFEPFFTTKGAGKGNGFGLATVYGIVTQSGGKIQVHSQPGKGATFEILLPAP